ncbi:putative Enoyl reductase (ER) domain-containing protein [Seiridium cardinale]|uniref:Enoyl reductase (ER) domain-containing protein n=1 Tax=Seiridium cardinale TaxID=138064 RepID=A0ABR2XDC5_9PEZI
MSHAVPQTYRAAVIETAGAPLVFKDLDIKQPGPREILVKVLACGVCHTDSAEQQGHLGDVFPRVPGHEIIGDVVGLGKEVTRFSVGDRIGGPWHGGHDGTCRQCARGQYQMCDKSDINGVTRDGGYAEYTILREEAGVRIPKDLDPAESAPLLCAGVTVFNSIRKLHVEQGNLVAIQGIGGLGHLAIQFARHMGYRVAAISSGEHKQAFAQQLGAHEYIDTSKEDAVGRLQALGGAAIIVATAPNPKAISPLLGGLQAGGKLLVLAPVGGIEVDSTAMVTKGLSVHGWPSGAALDSEDTLQFARDHGVKCMIEKFSLNDAQKAMDHCTSGNVRFRGVLVL